MINKKHDAIKVVLESILVFTLTSLAVFTISMISFCINLFFFNK